MNLTDLKNNGLSVTIWRFDWHNVIDIYYEKIGTDNFYWAELSVDTEKQYTWPEDVIKYGAGIPKSYFSDRLKGFYNTVME